MADSVNGSDQKFRVAVQARNGGRYMFQIFTMAGEPRTLQIDDNCYASPEEAERAGCEAVALLEEQLH
jgi:hypothetical protein